MVHGQRSARSSPNLHAETPPAALSPWKAFAQRGDPAAEYKVPERFKGYTADLPPFFGGMAGYLKGMYAELQR